MPERRQRNDADSESEPSDSASDLSEFIADHTDESVSEIDAGDTLFAPPWYSAVEEVNPEDE
ncbi:hypothetical protein [Halorubrum sp. F4]|uniref:hypothetical protein n=1 Tax=Halorubrum sp. F4 TaxID=2989715 RepID=UPI002480895D|nr:hypothetical protein [Halorubrum sp. F4]